MIITPYLSSNLSKDVSPVPLCDVIASTKVRFHICPGHSVSDSSHRRHLLCGCLPLTLIFFHFIESLAKLFSLLLSMITLQKFSKTLALEHKSFSSCCCS